ncbi:MAG: hypothetical protein QOF02_477 [Blastocatellia bacterium]|jgi:uncharacterized protein (TIGR03437 family)|nr:hypothetical protein [Blastocatellia bacterium]
MCILLTGAFVAAQAQNPDTFVTQISSSSVGNTYVGDMSLNGRFVVFESTGDIATEKTATRNNADGNREIFLFDYAQRRIFQITNTKSALRAASACPTPSPTPTPSPSPTPTPTPAPTPIPGCAIDVEVSNNQPVLSSNGRWIIFSSNAPTPADYDGNTAANHTALSADGNQEVFIYFIPAVANPAADLSSGVEEPLTDLTAGTFTRVTDTPASRTPTPGTATTSPFVAFDNREASANDNASVVAFVSTRNLTGGNADFNPEVFLYNRLTATTVQLTSTTTTSANNPIFNSNPTLAGQTLPGTVALSFFSNANISIGGTGNNADNNGEVYLGTFDGTTATVTRQATRTTSPVTGFVINVFNAGRRISRDGNLVAFESYSADPKTNGTAQANPAIFVYNVTSDTFTQVGPRATSGSDVQRFPTFTFDNTTLIFASALNFRADGTVPPTAADGLNPNGRVQVFSTPVPPATISFTRLSNTFNTLSFRLQPFPSNTRDRIAFSMEGTELGGGNADGSAEGFYLLTRAGTEVASPTVSFFTGASQRPIATPSPTPPAVNGLAPGMIGIIRSTSTLAPGTQVATGASESLRRPPLPVEMSGVTVSVNTASAGLLSIMPNEIRFVVPVGLAATIGTNTYPVTINNNGSVIRSTIQINPTQPDIFSTTNDAGGRAIVLNVTNPAAPTPEPFTVTSLNSGGTSVPTILQIMLTGVRNMTPSTVTVRIGTTDITGVANILLVGPTDMPGVDQINVQLPATLAGAGDVPIIVSVTIGGVTYTSRPADTAPHITIN